MRNDVLLNLRTAPYAPMTRTRQTCAMSVYSTHGPRYVSYVT
jgi:hypothetical protein